MAPFSPLSPLRNRLAPWALGTGVMLTGLSGCDRTYNVARSGTAKEGPCRGQDVPLVLFLDNTGDSYQKRAVAHELFSDMQRLNNINPSFLCGIRGIEVRGDVEFYVAKGDPHQAAHYEIEPRIIRINQYSTGTFYHEVGHHVQHSRLYPSVIRAALDTTWNSEGATCTRRDCFVSEYASTNPVEDWAETFSEVTEDPLGTAAAQTFNLFSDSARPLVVKLYQAYRVLPSNIQRSAALDFGEARELPPSKLRFTDGTWLFLVDTDKNSFMKYDLRKRGNVVPANQDGRAYIGRHINGRDYTDYRPEPMAARVGTTALLYSRDGAFNPSTVYDDTHMEFLSLETTSVPTGNGYHERGILGEILAANEGWEFFVRHEERLSLKSLRLDDRGVKEEVKWSLPSDFMPIHVMPLKDQTHDYLAIGFRNSPVAKYRRDMQVLLLKEPPRRRSYEAYWGRKKWSDIVPVKYDFWKKLNKPLQIGKLVLFPTYHLSSRGLPQSAFGFFGYDLEQQRFVTIIVNSIKNLPSAMTQPPARIRNLQVIKDDDDGLHLIVSTLAGPTFEIPISLEFND